MWQQPNLPDVRACLVAHRPSASADVGTCRHGGLETEDPSTAQTLPRRAALILALTWACSAGADVLVQGPGFVLSDGNVVNELESLPAAKERQTRADPRRLRQLVDDLYRRKAIVHAAEQADVTANAGVRNRLARARELELTRIMADRQREEAAEAVPDMTARAREIYKTEPESAAVPEKIHVRHILLRAGSDEERQNRRSEAQALLARLRDGQDFGELAREVSEDPGSAQKGGDLGYFTRGKMVKEFEDAAFALREPGDLSDPVETRFGLHILKLEGREPERQRSFEEVKDVIIGNLEREWVKQEVEAWRRAVVSPDRAEIDDAAIDAFIDRMREEKAPTPADAPSVTQ